MSSKKKGVNLVLVIVIIIIIVLVLILAGLNITGNVISFFKKEAAIISQEELITDGTGLNATIYNNQDFTGTKVNRIDPNVNFSWGSGSPDPSIGADTFSIRWEGYVIPSYSELYTFYTYSNDGMRIYVNNQLIVSDWSNHVAREKTGTIALQAGQPYPIKIEYYEGSNTAEVQARWSSSSQTKQVIPQSALRNSLDIGLPSVSITSPAQNQLITTFPFTVNADASDSDGILSVELQLDIDPVTMRGSSYDFDYEAPYSFTIPSGTLENGYQTAMAIVTDTEVNMQKSNVIGFYLEDFNQMPSRISNLKNTSTSSSITLTWNDTYGELNYIIERARGKVFTQIATLPQNSNTYTDNNLFADTIYYYRLKANNTVGMTTKVILVKTAPIGLQSQCENGLDDDNDELIDYPADPGCSSTTDNDETNIPRGSKPDATNTGPDPSIQLRLDNSANEITRDGTILENFYTSGGFIIDIRASNVVLRNFRHNAGGSATYAIRAIYGAKNITIENAEIYNADRAIIYGSNMVIRNSHIHEGYADGIKTNSGGDMRIENSYIHHIGKGEGSHADGFQIISSGNNYTFIGNNFDMPCCYMEPGYKGSTIIITTIKDGGSGPKSIIFDGNWINGGNWALQTGGAPNRVVNNKFGKDCNFGLMNGNPTVWANNSWEDTGELITLTEADSGGDKYCRGG